MNPNKVLVCKRLVELHEARGDKILVFSDSLAPLKHYGKILDRTIMFGETANDTRELYFKRFRMPNSHPDAIQTLCLSSIGDQAIDLPDANILIQVSSHFGSRRQEAQRLGRILRPKASTRLEESGYNAYFYTLVSTDTSDMHYSNNRRKYLCDQGYSFQVMHMDRVVQPITNSGEDEQKFLRESACLQNIENENREIVDAPIEPEEGETVKRHRE